MAKKQNTASAWFAKYGFFLLAFVPMIQWIPCFVMNGRTRKKRWLFMGIAYIAIGILSLVVMIAVQEWSTNNYVSYPKGPEEEDFRDFTYDDFKDENGIINWEDYDKARAEWRKTDSYDEYMEALEEHQESPEYKAVEAANRRRYRIEDATNGICTGTVVIKYFVYLVWIYFIERYRFKDEMKKLERANNSTKSSKGRKKVASVQNIEENWQSISNNIMADTTAKSRVEFDVEPDQLNGVLNINDATEAQIEALPLINVVDAKKIIAYRNENGGFKTVDEFFQCFNAKPHVIVKLSDSVTVENVVKKVASTSEAPSRQRFDL